MNTLKSGFQTVEVKDEASLLNLKRPASIGKKTSVDAANATMVDFKDHKPSSIENLSAQAPRRRIIKQIVS